MSKTALVTGAAAGIGRACAMRLAKEGIAVGVLDLKLADVQKTADEIEAAGGRAIALECDITNRAGVFAAVDKLRAAFGPVTIVVNNAGITGFSPFLDLTEEVWDRVYAVNVKGTVWCIQATVPDMIAAKWGRVVNMSSSSAQTGSPTMAHYSSSKGAIITLTRTLAQELGPHGITVNNIPPGIVMGTIMSEANRANYPAPLEEVAKMIPVGRTGVPDDIANACAWLVSEATGYVTGQTIGVNGGRVVS